MFARVLKGLLCSIAIGLAGTCAVQAQDYPTRPLHIVITYAPGSTTDILARVVASRLSPELGQPVLVESQAGGGGLIGARNVLSAQPVGYTLLYGSNAIFGNLHAYKNPGYKFDDFTVLGVTAMAPWALVVPTNLPAKDLKEFVAWVKASPDKYNYGSIGPSAIPSLLMERLKASTGMSLQPVLYKGSDPALLAMLGGEIQAYFPTVGTARTRVVAGQARALAVGDSKRSEALPDVPTFKELGYDNMELMVWNALFAPSSAPKPVIAKLQSAMAKVTASPELKAQTGKMSMVSWTDTLEIFNAHIKAEAASVGEDFRRLKLPVED